MLDFREPLVSDYGWAGPIIERSGNLGDESSFANIFLYRKKYGMRICRYGNFLLLAYFTGDRLRAYNFPIGDGDLSDAVNAVFEDADERGVLPEFWVVPDGKREELDKICPGEYIYELDRDDVNYIYKRENLALLPGSKFHGKRNHASQFEREYPGWHYEKLCQANFTDAQKVSSNWFAKRTEEADDGEQNAIKEAFENFDALGLFGGILYVDSRPVAMTVASRINEKVCDVHFEKAQEGVHGAYAVINREFAIANQELEYINREEDMGLEGLRTAKLSYHPDMMPDVYFAVPRESEVTFRGAQESDFGQLKKLWSKCFSEGPLGVDLIFSKLYRPENCFVAVSERGIAAQLDLIPVFVNGERAHYLYGACTDPVFQHRKIMRHLISYALDRAKERGDCLSLLYPANVELYSFYEKSGYKGCFGESVYIVERSKAQGLASEPSANNTDLYDFRQSLLPQDAVIWSRSEFEFAIEYNEIYGGKAVSVSGGYALVSGTENGRAEVYEFLCRPGCESELLGGVLAASDAAEFVIRVPKGKDFFGADNEGLPVGMFLSLSDNKTENVYFGLTFE